MDSLKAELEQASQESFLKLKTIQSLQEENAKLGETVKKLKAENEKLQNTQAAGIIQ